MREALRGLTVRGRAFLAAGATAVLCAVVLDQRPLIEVGVLLIALPLVTALVIGRGRYQLSLVRTVEPSVVEAGRPARVRLTVAHEGWIPTGSLLLEDRLPAVLGTRPRFVIGRVPRGWRQTLSYPVRASHRGRFLLGPLHVRVSDPFGLVQLERAFHTTTTLTVTPPVHPLTPIGVSGGESASGDRRAREFAGGSPEDVTVRDYRRGDDLRRVHWRTSARMGELMVRREEQPWQAYATVFLDNRNQAHHGHGPASFEAAVVAAASVAVHLTRRGFSVRLATSSDGASASARHARDREADVSGLLEALALVRPTRRAALDTAWIGEQGVAGLTVAILGAVDTADQAALRRVRLRADAALAITFGPEDAVPRLTRDGWRASALSPGGAVDRAWQELR